MSVSVATAQTSSPTGIESFTPHAATVQVYENGVPVDHFLNVVVATNGVAGSVYDLLASDDCVTWQPVLTSVADDSGRFTFADVEPLGVTRRFYIIRSED